MLFCRCCHKQGGDVLYKRISAIGLILAILLVHFSAMGALAAEDKIGFVDTQKVLSSHSKYESSQKHLEEFVKKKSDAAKAAAAKETDNQKKAAIIEKAREESGAEEMRVMNPITDEITKTIEKVAKSKGVTVVLNKVLIYFGGIDLTEDVIKALKEKK